MAVAALGLAAPLCVYGSAGPCLCAHLADGLPAAPAAPLDYIRRASAHQHGTRGPRRGAAPSRPVKNFTPPAGVGLYAVQGLYRPGLVVLRFLAAQVPD